MKAGLGSRMRIYDKWASGFRVSGFADLGTGDPTLIH